MCLELYRLRWQVELTFKTLEVPLPLRPSTQSPRRHDPHLAVRQAIARGLHAANGLRGLVAFPPGAARSRRAGTRCRGSRQHSVARHRRALQPLDLPTLLQRWPRLMKRLADAGSHRPNRARRLLEPRRSSDSRMVRARTGDLRVSAELLTAMVAVPPGQGATLVMC